VAAFDDFPVLRIRADKAAAPFITEISLGGIDLLAMGVVSVDLRAYPNELITATLTIECVPDIELPASVTINNLTPKRVAPFDKLPLILDDGLPHKGVSYPDGTNQCDADCPSCTANAHQTV
jgi:hypothetical protein